MYRVSGKQLILLALGSALVAAAVVACAQRMLDGKKINVESSAIADPSVASDEQNNIEVYREVSPGVVNITSTSYVQGWFGAYPQEGTGSGSIIDLDGHILTNYHVVRDVDEIRVTLADKRSFVAVVVGTDPQTDLAVIKIKDKVPADLPVAELGDSDALRVGDWVLAVGAPFGYEHTVTAGIVSAKGRSMAGSDNYQDFIQTDAAINPGNSGGALVDAAGNLVGINSAIFSKSGGSMGIGFAIPASLAKQVMEQIIRSGAVVRGWIGVEVQDISPELADSFKLASPGGALISGVLRGGPADRAGIRAGDILQSINGKPVSDSTSMLNQVASLTPGQTASLKIIRNRAELTAQVNIGRRPRQAPRN